jgi:16S rRNA (adenine1518-N6/adenine1519-N6)-dimethyltransferase
MVYAKKSLGQHFLIDPEIISRIIAALDPKQGETVLEIGPGEGVLTLPLLRSGANIVAVELDCRLAPELSKLAPEKTNFKVFEADILRFDPKAIGLGSFALIGNLPYNISTPVMDWILTYHGVIDRAVLMMQKEVADRVTSPPGRRARSTISVLTSLYYDSEMVCDVPPEAFRPRPKVDSAVVRFVRHNRSYGIDNPERFEKFIRFCFRNKRKNLLNNLNSAYPIRRDELEKLIEELFTTRQIRAEQMELDQFITLYNAILSRV